MTQRKYVFDSITLIIHIFSQLCGKLSIHSSSSVSYLHSWLNASVKKRLSKRLYKQRCYQHRPYKKSLSRFLRICPRSLCVAFLVTRLVGFDTAVCDVSRRDLWLTSATPPTLPQRVYLTDAINFCYANPRQCARCRYHEHVELSEFFLFIFFP